MRDIGSGLLRLRLTRDEDLRVRDLYERIHGHRAETSVKLNDFACALLLGAVVELESALWKARPVK